MTGQFLYVQGNIKIKPLRLQGLLIQNLNFAPCQGALFCIQTTLFYVLDLVTFDFRTLYFYCPENIIHFYDVLVS